MQAFQLADDGPGARNCWYYIKLRPGLREFLANISQLYELHIYTMGTRAYAQNIAHIIDPERRIFGDRILSRDESGSLTAKNLHRLFPVDTKMVVIIDDRGDVWQWSDNLVKVTPYDFFVGIGDINSSFLPSKPELPPSPRILRLTMPRPNNDLAEGATIREPDPAPSDALDASSPQHGSPSGSTADVTTPSSPVSALDQLVSMSGGNDPAVLLQQASKQDEALAAQLEDRPLLQKQRQLDAEDDASAAAAASTASSPLATETHNAEDDHQGNGIDGINGSGDSSGSAANVAPDQPLAASEQAKPRQNLLRDDDTELRYLEHNLRQVHGAFFGEYDRRLASAQGGRLAALRGDKRARKIAVRDDSTGDLELVPDIKHIMPQMKRSVLEGAVLVFSGLVPLGTDIQR